MSFYSVSAKAWRSFLPMKDLTSAPSHQENAGSERQLIVPMLSWFCSSLIAARFLLRVKPSIAKKSIGINFYNTIESESFGAIIDHQSIESQLRIGPRSSREAIAAVTALHLVLNSLHHARQLSSGRFGLGQSGLGRCRQGTGLHFTSGLFL